MGRAARPARQDWILIPRLAITTRSASVFALIFFAMLSLPVCPYGETKPAAKEGMPILKITLTSSAFKEGETMPVRHTCCGPDVSPPLTWPHPPAGTRSMALLCEDPDAPRGLWVHWVLWGLPADSTSLPEAVAKDKTLKGGALQGKNDFGRIGYGGPCPPPGKPHRYFFRIYALDRLLDLKPGATRSDLLKAMEGHILAEGELMGRFAR